MRRKFDIEVPVLIVGGGGAGLTSSILLSRLGVRSLLVTRYAETTSLPRGHMLHQRTMEILTDMGVAPQVTAVGTPPEHMRTVGWYSGFAGGGPANGHGRRLGSVEAWGGGYTDPDYIAASPCPAVNLSLLRTEPIFKARAEEYPEATLRFHHELVGIEQDADGVYSTILDRDSGETYTVKSAYVLGADGGRTVADLVGATMGGAQKVRKMISLYLSADLSEYLAEADDSIITWVFNPEYPENLDYGGALVPQGPTRWGRHSEEWLLIVSRPDVDVSQPEKMVEWGRQALGIPGWAPEVHGVSEWWLESVLADDFRIGQVFLLGDAAHRVPPSGGLGLNTAIQDAYNLTWKIAAVLGGRAGDGLLDTYTTERRPVSQANIDASTSAVFGHDKLAPALGISSAKSVEENWQALSAFWEDGPGAAERRHEFNKWRSHRTLEFRQHAVDFGYAYEDGAIVPDGSPKPVPIDAVRLYEPSTRPGAPLPHAWVERSSERLPLRDLTHGGHFALIAGEDGQEWVDAAKKVAGQLNVPLRTARVGMGDVDLIDAHLAWKRNKEISATGALLVRPDGYIAFRSLGAVDDPVAVLSAAFGHILNLDPALV